MMQERRKLKSLWAQKAGTENKGKKMRGKKKNKKDFSSLFQSLRQIELFQ